MSGNYPDYATQLGSVNLETLKATYRGGASGLAGPVGIFATLFGSASKTIRITRISVSVTAATAALVAVTLNKYSAAPTGGTKGTAPAMVPLDSGDPAATATGLNIYTVAPTAGTLVGLVDSVRGLAGSATVTGNQQWEFPFSEGAKCLVLNGASEGIGLVLSAAGTVDFSIEWIEE